MRLRWKTWEKKKMLITRFFYCSHDVFKTSLFHLWSMNVKTVKDFKTWSKPGTFLFFMGVSSCCPEETHTYTECKKLEHFILECRFSQIE